MRDLIRAELEAIAPLDDPERDHLTDALAWVHSGADLCVARPATLPKRLVSYFQKLGAYTVLRSTT